MPGKLVRLGTTCDGQYLCKTKESWKATPYLEISASEHTLVEDQSLRNKIGLRELYVRIAVIRLNLYLGGGIACRRDRRECRWLLTLWDVR